MTTAPRGALEGSSGLYDPSILFDLEDILMSESNDVQSHSLVHTPIKEEPEFDHDDVNRFATSIIHHSMGIFACFRFLHLASVNQSCSASSKCSSGIL